MSGNKIMCNQCEISFSSNSNYNQHLKRIHKIMPVLSLICPFCESRFSFNKFLQVHIKTEHPDFKLRCEEKLFRSHEDFKSWLSITEKEEKCNFVKHSSRKILSDGRHVTHYFCNRSGQSKPKKQKVKNSKLAGSIKIGKTCPAFISCYTTKKKKSLKVEVKMQLSHAGHELEVNKLRISREDRIYLAELLKSGLPKSNILSEMRKKFSNESRLGILNAQDLRNIYREFNIKNDFILKKNDVSIDVIVKNLENEHYNPLLIYKPINVALAEYSQLKNEDFILAIMFENQLKVFEAYGNDQCILIDETYGSNQYDFHLTTLFVSDENKEAFPVAVLYSSKIDVEIFVSFFDSIKNRLSLNEFNVKVFMSDDIPVFYDAWMQVFGNVDYCLISTWHVIRSIKKNLNSKVKNGEVRKNMTKELLKIISETDENTFNDLTCNFINKYVHEEKHFTNYFLSHYMPRSKMWAACFRKNLTVNTNIKVDKWYSQIKHEEGEKKIIKRLDRSIQLVIDVITNNSLKIVNETNVHVIDTSEPQLEEQEVYLVECDVISEDFEKEQLQVLNFDKKKEELDSLYHSLLKECSSLEHISVLENGLKSIQNQFTQCHSQTVEFTNVSTPENYTFVIL